MKNKKHSWEKEVKKALEKHNIYGWTILEIKGRGVFLLPCDLEQNPRNRTGENRQLTGKYKIVFEFFRLDKTGKIKISARVASILGQQLFHEFWGIARSCVSDKPKKTAQKNSQSVAKWDLGKGRTFKKKDVSGMTEATRDFIMNPPCNFTWFVLSVRNYINN